MFSMMPLLTVLAQVGPIPSDLIGPLIFGAIFLGSWIWNGYKKTVKRRREKELREGLSGGAGMDASARTAPPPFEGAGSRTTPRRAPGRSGPTPTAGAGRGGGGAGGGSAGSPALSMRQRIERARAEAAAGGRQPASPAPRSGPNPSSAPAARPAPAPRPRPAAAKRQEALRAAASARRAKEQARVASPPLSRPSGPVGGKPAGGVAEAAPAVVTIQDLRLDREAMRQAIVWSEILRPPVSLREPGES